MTGAQALFEGWPVMATLAIAAAAGRVRDVRRRESLNTAVHELRRPLQILALAAAGPSVEAAPRVVRSLQAPVRGGASPLELTWTALADLERQINGDAEAFRPRLVRCRALLQDTAERWQAAAELGGGSVALRVSEVGLLLHVDPARVGQALDNLIANALEHGGPRVEIDVALAAQRVRIGISGWAPYNASAIATAPVAAGRVEVGALRARLEGRRRRGHGLRAVTAIAALHGGRLLMTEAEGAKAAVLELPLAGADAAAPARGSFGAPAGGGTSWAA